MATTSATQPTTITKNLSLRIDGQDVTVREGTTICEAAAQLGIAIPVLCHDDRYDPVGVCRMCVVDVGARVYAAACVRPVRGGDGGHHDRREPRAPPGDAHRAAARRPARPADDPKETTTGDNELSGAGPPVRRRDGRRAAAPGRGARRSMTPTRSSRSTTTPASCATAACAPATTSRATTSSAAAARATPPGSPSTSTTRWASPRASPAASASRPARPARSSTSRCTASRSGRAAELRQVDTVCPYCGVGCALTYHVDERAQRDRLRRGPRAARLAEGRLCVKGRYGWDYARSPQRLTTPLIRREDSYPKGPLSGDVQGEGRGRRKPGGLVDYDEVMPHFREASWEEALDLIASRLVGIRDEHGPGADRRLRLGQVLQRRGLPVPEADPRGLRHQQRRPLHAAVPRLERRRPVRGRRLGRGLHDLRRHHQRRRRDPRRHEHDRQPPGRLVVLQAGPPPGHEADRRRPPPRARRRPRRHLLPDQARHRRRVLQRRHARDHRDGPGRRGVHRQAHQQLRGAGRTAQAVLRPSAPARSAASRRAPCARSRGSGARPDRRSSTGAWGSPSTPPAPTTPAA